MGKNTTFLLDDGEELQLSETVTLKYYSVGNVKQTVLTPTQEREKKVLSPQYLITGRLLGEGAYGKVLIGIDQTTQHQLACKMIDLHKICDRRTLADLRTVTSEAHWSSCQAMRQLPSKVQSTFREFNILKDLSHPNIVHIQKVFWSQDTIYIFQELVTGGDLFSYIEYKHGKIPSIEAAVIVRQVLKGVQYLHDQDIVHRDLKPDNILMTSLDSGARVVITDFGNARFLPNSTTQAETRSNKLKRMFTTVGTLEYAAPEIHKANRAIPRDHGYSLSIDMWAIGSITAAILTGEHIFKCQYQDEDAQRIIELAAQCDLRILDDEFHPLWGSVGSHPKNFIKRLLVLNEEERMSATEALNHVWFSHPYMAAEFDAEYQRAIKDWHPRHNVNTLIEQISICERDVVAPSGSNGIPQDEAASHFFASKHRSSQGFPSDKHQCDDRPQSLPRCGDLSKQFASQPSYDDECSLHQRQQYSHANDHVETDQNSNTASGWYPDEHEIHVEHTLDDSHNSESITSKGSNRAYVGQLQRVSTSTRDKYFGKESIDLDQLEQLTDDVHEHESMTKLYPNNVAQVQPQARLCRDDTVQVRTTPFTNDKEHGGTPQWWYHPYPGTQYHYDTQAEPITQEDDYVLVEETPPEMFATPPRSENVDTLNHHYTFEQRLELRRPAETLVFPQASKRRKVYGRKR
jgi:serine/threonine protein kinase